MKKKEQIFGGGVEYPHRECEEYREVISNAVNQIDDIWTLKVIHRFITAMTKEGN